MKPAKLHDDAVDSITGLKMNALACQPATQPLSAVGPDLATIFLYHLEDINACSHPVNCLYQSYKWDPTVDMSIC